MEVALALAPGSRLGPYEIVEPLGAGGMGEVYRAKDTRLGRDVAIKVLPDALSANAELRARLEREARTISQLNHPNVCTLFDVGREADTAFLVMELVEGDTLSRRLEKGPLPPADVLRIGIEVAGALERAHRSGIVHRDLKPGNIMLTRTGSKLMDFGLARGGVLANGPSQLSQSPTLAAPLTAEGHIVGTFRYMAPEQLEGSEADARSDIWALGCVLYEMATGRPPFEGRSQASLIAGIMHTEPTPISQLQPLAPAGLDRIVRACLAKDPADRIQTAHDVRMQLEWLAEPNATGSAVTTSSGSIVAPVIPHAPATTTGRRALVFSALAGALVVGAAVLIARALAPSPAPRVLRYYIQAPNGVNSISWPRISPDGRMLAFMATDSSGTVRIWVRPMDTDAARPLPTTEGATRMFWSPDSRSLAYMSQGDLRRVSIDGGPSTPIAKVPGASDGSWGAETILLDGNIQDSIRAVPASGGDARPATHVERRSGEGGIAWPSFLPDGKHFLAVASLASNLNGTANIRIGQLGTLDTKAVGKTDGRAEYANPGYLVFPRENSLMAQRFDAAAGKTLGDPIPLAENLGGLGSGGDYSVSRDGILVFRPTGNSEGTRLQWVDRAGRPLGDPSTIGSFGDVALSPDGHRVAYSLTNNNLSEIWVRDLDRGTDQRVTFEGHFEFNPVWSPDGSRIAYSSDVSGTNEIFIRRADGTGERDSLSLPKGASFVGPVDWSSDGARIVARQQTAAGLWDITIYSSPFHDAPTPFTSTPFIERWASISHDGRWIAYESNETGRFEVFVRPADGGAGKWQISVNGGRYPLWRADGRELFFQSPDVAIMAVPVQVTTGFVAGNPVALFRHDFAALGYTGRSWAVSVDGQRFLLCVPSTSSERPHFEVVVNWPQTLRQK